MNTDSTGLTQLKYDLSRSLLFIDPEQPSAIPYALPATSGVLNCGCGRADAWKGPIPPGSYVIRPSELSKPSSTRIFLRNLLADWGSFRVAIHPQSGTQTYGRSGFFLHGGVEPRSAGCIDVGGGVYGDDITDDLVTDLRSDPDDQIPLVVK
jgi:hypothetical protein